MKIFFYCAQGDGYGAMMVGQMVRARLSREEYPIAISSAPDLATTQKQIDEEGDLVVFFLSAQHVSVPWLVDLVNYVNDAKERGAPKLVVKVAMPSYLADPDARLDEALRDAYPTSGGLQQIAAQIAYYATFRLVQSGGFTGWVPTRPPEALSEEGSGSEAPGGWVHLGGAPSPSTEQTPPPPKPPADDTEGGLIHWGEEPSTEKEAPSTGASAALDGDYDGLIDEERGVDAPAAPPAPGGPPPAPGAYVPSQYPEQEQQPFDPSDWVSRGDSTPPAQAEATDRRAHGESGAKQKPSSGEGADASTLQFSAYHPNAVAVGTWQTLIVYTYLAEALAQIQADAATFTELGSAPTVARGQSARQVEKGVELTMEPHMEGVTFSPERESFIWRGDWRRTLFRFSGAAELAGRAQSGWIDIYAGPMVPVARIDLTVPFHDDRSHQLAAQPPRGMIVSSNLYDAVFISYSHRDGEAFRQACEEYHRFGITVYTDQQLEAGAHYEAELSHRIAEANVFHLLWSPHSAASGECRKEWLAALQREPSERFIKPWFWHQPLSTPPKEFVEHRISFKYEPLRRSLWRPSTWFA